MSSPTQWPADKIVRRKVSKLVPYARNARTHSDEQIGQIAAAINEWGWTIPVLVDEAGGVIAGHGRLLAAETLGIETVPALVARGWTEAQKRAYVIADNKLATNAGWDDDLLRSELAALSDLDFEQSLLGFGTDELSDMADALEALADDEVPVPSPPPDPITRPGDILELGDHRLLCADASDTEQVSRLFADARASLVFSSPPYDNQRQYKLGERIDWLALMKGVFAPMSEVLAHEAQILINLGLIHHDHEWHPYWDPWIAWMREEGWRRFGLYVWDQGPGLPGDWNGRLAPSFELVFHFNKISRRANKTLPKLAKSICLGHGSKLRDPDGTLKPVVSPEASLQPNKIPDNVIRVVRQKGPIGQGLDHPAVFPVDFAQFVIDAFTASQEIVYEPFCGSGSTVIAGEKLGRRVFAIEIEPAYVDVAVERWERFTGRKAVRHGAIDQTG